MKKLPLSLTLILSLIMISCSGSGEKTIHDTIYVSTEKAAELITPDVNLNDTTGAGDSHYTMLEGTQPPSTPANSQQPKRSSSSSSSNESGSLSYSKPPQSVPAPSWHSFTYSGYTQYGDKRFPIKITGQKKTQGGSTTYKNCKYTNINYSVTFPVNVYENYGDLTIVNSKSSDDLRIEAEISGDMWVGTMYAGGNALDCYLYQ